MQKYKIIRIRIIQLRIIYSFLIVSLVDSQKAVQYELPLQKPPPILETSYIGGRKYMGVAASQNGPIDLSSLLEPKASPDQKRRNQLKSNILMPRNLYTYHPKPLYLWHQKLFLFNETFYCIFFSSKKLFLYFSFFSKKLFVSLHQ